MVQDDSLNLRAVTKSSSFIYCIGHVTSQSVSLCILQLKMVKTSCEYILIRTREIKLCVYCSSLLCGFLVKLQSHFKQNKTNILVCYFLHVKI